MMYHELIIVEVVLGPFSDILEQDEGTNTLVEYIQETLVMLFGQVQ